MMRPVFLLIVTACIAVGCTSSPRSRGQLLLAPQKTSKRFTQNFTQAYASHNTEDGSYQFLLIADETEVEKRKASRGALRPVSENPLRQVVHVQIPWMPERGHISDAVVANASVDWYIFSDTTQPDLVQYSGVGFGLAYPSDRTTDLNLKTAELKPQVVRGGLSDPLGPFTVWGDVRAINDARRFQELLGATRQRISAPVTSAR